MSRLYLIRHAQAGPRHRYDQLSELGRRQAQLLGAHLAQEGIQFDQVYCGELARQRQTAAAVQVAYAETGLEFPELCIDPLWNEFDLDSVYRQLAHRLAQDDPVFSREYATLRNAMADENHAIHRNHSYCDIEVIRAWVEARYPYDGESWPHFRARVLGARAPLADIGSGHHIAVFTSGTPLCIWSGEALQLSDREIWRLAGVSYNTGITTLRMSRDDLRLFTFNGVPHLTEPRMRTFR